MTTSMLITSWLHHYHAVVEHSQSCYQKTKQGMTLACRRKSKCRNLSPLLMPVPCLINCHEINIKKKNGTRTGTITTVLLGTLTFLKDSWVTKVSLLESAFWRESSDQKLLHKKWFSHLGKCKAMQSNQHLQLSSSQD